ncbi:Hypothetical protein NTJ_04473 [Nesidiocoris tenuis]|uniref:Uncharacterized protein n=1 Tax=Nesidiocoris tenuis TaxID=355587 RepID=A0ABN7AKE4_9HEMI|nr:Hypothetical protein NTJ_04473 [Nesidiocoris tenuis]
MIIMFSLHILLALVLIGSARAITIDSKIDVDPPVSLLVKNSDGELTLDSSISPKVVKAFYEIHFVPADRVDPNSIVTVTTTQKCPFQVNTDLCKFYFTPSKIIAVQKIDDLIEKTKGDGTVPVLQGVNTDKVNTDQFMKEVNDTIHNKVNAVVPLHSKNKTEGVPVYTGTVNTQEVLRKPELTPYPYRPYYPPPSRPPYPWNTYNGWNNCLQAPCPWRTPYSSSVLNPGL